MKPPNPLPPSEKILLFHNEELNLILEEIRALKKEVETKSDCWLDKKAAAQYMGICLSSFDKYRYETNPRLTGHNLDGKVLYKKSDIDSFIRLYAIKSRLAAA